jgi:hypothetical protein
VLLMDEVAANMSFGQLKRGDRLQVDIHDPAVAGLIKGGYLRIVWKERGDARELDSADDPAGSGRDAAGHLGSGGAGELQTEEALDGQGEHQPGEEDSDSP